MIQFNLNRFGSLAKWSLTNDKGFYLKQALTIFVVLTLLFLYFTTSHFTFTMNGAKQNYVPCCFSVIIMIMITVITGPSWMFSSETGDHERQALLMLPASNFEKYLMRYSTWIILLPLYIVGFFAADLVQYLVNVLSGHEGAFLTVKMVDVYGIINNSINNSFEGSEVQKWRFLHGMIIFAIWLNSLYALGGTFFRSRKFSWVLTTVAIIVLIMLFETVCPEGSDDNKGFTMREVVVWDVIYAAWIIVNFWLSYRLFCRQQVIGKFVNL